MSDSYIIPETEADDTPRNFTSRGHRPAHYNTHRQAEAAPERRNDFYFSAYRQPYLQQADQYRPHQSELMRLCGESERIAVRKSREKKGQVFIVGKSKSGIPGTKKIVSQSGYTPKYITPDMDTPLSGIKQIPKPILETLKRAQIHDVGDLCMIRRNGLSRHHILTDSDLDILCDAMEEINIFL